jgi:hypothetical protein
MLIGNNALLYGSIYCLVALTYVSMPFYGFEQFGEKSTSSAGCIRPKDSLISAAMPRQQSNIEEALYYPVKVELRC